MFKQRPEVRLIKGTVNVVVVIVIPNWKTIHVSYTVSDTQSTKCKND